MCPACRGIGVKTAADPDQRLMATSIRSLARAEEIKQPKRREQLLMESADDARLSRELVKLRDDVPVADGIETMAKSEPPDPGRAFPVPCRDVGVH